MEVSLSVLGGCSSRTADTHADTRRIVDALNSLNARVPGGIQPENIHLEFHKIPNEPDTFLLQVNVPGATRDRAIDMQAVLVAALERAGLKV